MAAASDGSITAAGLTGLRSSLNQTADNFAVSGLTRTPTPLLSDPFDRANAATLGAAWANRVGDFGVTGNKAVANAPVALATLAGVSAADVSLQATVAVAAGQAAGLAARYGGPGDANMYWGTVIATANGGFAAEIWRNLDGTWKRLASASLASGSGLLRFEVAGSSLKLFVDGALKASATDTTIAGPGLAGLRASAGQTFDNFVATSLGV